MKTIDVTRINWTRFRRVHIKSVGRANIRTRYPRFKVVRCWLDLNKNTTLWGVKVQLAPRHGWFALKVGDTPVAFEEEGKALQTLSTLTKQYL